MREDIYIYNTVSLSKELFKPIGDDRVLMYVCGITAYDFAHLGHARAYITFDIIYRYLKRAGYDVVYVRNFTDIDDKIIKRANEENSTVGEVSSRYIAEYEKDMSALSVSSPDYEPKATETIPEMINLVSGLMAKGNAYEKNGDVFFRVGSFKEYGKLSHKNLGELVAGSRVPQNEEKENPLDFALWKSSKPGEPSWDSPWGKGRPGWHIECSAMSMKFLGESIDIHGGGSDLIFPHHENEIAQSESYTGKKFVNYWIHNGFVNIDNEKMSKSLKNFITIRDLLSKYHPEVVRLFFMFTHYRSFIDFSYDGLDSAGQSLIRLYQALKLYGVLKKAVEEGNIKIVPKPADNYSGTLGGQDEAALNQAMNDDFNTPVALSVIFNAVRGANKIISDSFSSKVIGTGEYDYLNEMFSVIKSFSNDVLGILMEDADKFTGENLRDVSKIGISEEEIEGLIGRRNDCRKNKEYAKADEIRKLLLEKGVALEDTGLGTTYKIIKR